MKRQERLFSTLIVLFLISIVAFTGCDRATEELATEVDVTGQLDLIRTVDVLAIQQYGGTFVVEGSAAYALTFATDKGEAVPASVQVSDGKVEIDDLYVDTHAEKLLVTVEDEQGQALKSISMDLNPKETPSLIMQSEETHRDGVYVEEADRWVFYSILDYLLEKPLGERVAYANEWDAADPKTVWIVMFAYGYSPWEDYSTIADLDGDPTEELPNRVWNKDKDEWYNPHEGEAVPFRVVGDSIEDVADFAVAWSTEIEDIVLPDTVKANIDDAADTEVDLNVEWDEKDYDKAEPGDYTFTGTLSHDDYEILDDDKEIEVKVTVNKATMKPGSVEVFADPFYVAKGITDEELKGKLPQEVKITIEETDEDVVVTIDWDVTGFDNQWIPENQDFFGTPQLPEYMDQNTAEDAEATVRVDLEESAWEINSGDNMISVDVEIKTGDKLQVRLLDNNENLMLREDIERPDYFDPHEKQVKFTSLSAGVYNVEIMLNSDSQIIEEVPVGAGAPKVVKAEITAIASDGTSVRVKDEEGVEVEYEVKAGTGLVTYFSNIDSSLRGSIMEFELDNLRITDVLTLFLEDKEYTATGFNSFVPDGVFTEVIIQGKNNPGVTKVDGPLVEILMERVDIRNIDFYCEEMIIGDENDENIAERVKISESNLEMDVAGQGLRIYGWRADLSFNSVEGEVLIEGRYVKFEADNYEPYAEWDGILEPYNFVVQGRDAEVTINESYTGHFWLSGTATDATVRIHDDYKLNYRFHIEGDDADVLIDGDFEGILTIPDEALRATVRVTGDFKSPLDIDGDFADLTVEGNFEENLIVNGENVAVLVEGKFEADLTINGNVATITLEDDMEGDFTVNGEDATISLTDTLTGDLTVFNPTTTITDLTRVNGDVTFEGTTIADDLERVNGNLTVDAVNCSLNSLARVDEDLVLNETVEDLYMNLRNVYGNLIINAADMSFFDLNVGSPPDYDNYVKFEEDADNVTFTDSIITKLSSDNHADATNITFDDVTFRRLNGDLTGSEGTLMDDATFTINAGDGWVFENVVWPDYNWDEPHNPLDFHVTVEADEVSIIDTDIRGNLRVDAADFTFKSTDADDRVTLEGILTFANEAQNAVFDYVIFEDSVNLENASGDENHAPVFRNSEMHENLQNVVANTLFDTVVFDFDQWGTLIAEDGVVFDTCIFKNTEENHWNLLHVNDIGITTTVTSTTFEGITALLVEGGSAVIHNSTFEDDSALQIWGPDVDDVELRDCHFTEEANIFVLGGGNLSIIDTTIKADDPVEQYINIFDHTKDVVIEGSTIDRDVLVENVDDLAVEDTTFGNDVRIEGDFGASFADTTIKGDFNADDAIGALTFTDATVEGDTVVGSIDELSVADTDFLGDVTFGDGNIGTGRVDRGTIAGDLTVDVGESNKLEFFDTELQGELVIGQNTNDLRLNRVSFNADKDVEITGDHTHTRLILNNVTFDGEEVKIDAFNLAVSFRGITEGNEKLVVKDIDAAHSDMRLDAVIKEVIFGQDLEGITAFDNVEIRDCVFTGIQNVNYAVTFHNNTFEENVNVTDDEPVFEKNTFEKMLHVTTGASFNGDTVLGELTVEDRDAVLQGIILCDDPGVDVTILDVDEATFVAGNITNNQVGNDDNITYNNITFTVAQTIDFEGTFTDCTFQEELTVDDDEANFNDNTFEDTVTVNAATNFNGDTFKGTGTALTMLNEDATYEDITIHTHNDNTKILVGDSDKETHILDTVTFKETYADPVVTQPTITVVVGNGHDDVELRLLNTIDWSEASNIEFDTTETGATVNDDQARWVGPEGVGDKPFSELPVKF